MKSIENRTEFCKRSVSIRTSRRPTTTTSQEEGGEVETSIRTNKKNKQRTNSRRDRKQDNCKSNLGDNFKAHLARRRTQARPSLRLIWAIFLISVLSLSCLLLAGNGLAQAWSLFGASAGGQTGGPAPGELGPGGGGPEPGPASEPLVARPPAANPQKPPLRNPNGLQRNSAEPFLLLMSRTEISLVELPLIDNGRVSSVFISENNCTGSSSEIQQDSDSDQSSSKGANELDGDDEQNQLADELEDEAEQRDRDRDIKKHVSWGGRGGGKAEPAVARAPDSDGVGGSASKSSSSSVVVSSSDEKSYGTTKSSSNSNSNNTNDVNSNVGMSSAGEDAAAEPSGSGSDQSAASANKATQAAQSESEKDGRQMRRKKRSATSLGKFGEQANASWSWGWGRGRAGSGPGERRASQFGLPLKAKAKATELEQQRQRLHLQSQEKKKMQRAEDATPRRLGRGEAGEQIAQRAQSASGSGSGYNADSGSSSVSSGQRRGAALQKRSSDEQLAGGSPSSGGDSSSKTSIHNSDCELNDFDVHMGSGLVFASDGRGQIHKIQLLEINNSRFKFANTNDEPSSSPASRNEAGTDGETTASRLQLDNSTTVKFEEEPEPEQANDVLDATSSQHPSRSQQPTSGKTTTAAAAAASPAGTRDSHLSSERSRIIWSSRAGSSSRASARALRKLGGGGAAGQPNKASANKSSRSRALSVDWINDVLFVLDQNRLFCMDFDGKREILLIDDFVDLQRPLRLRLDPQNNFLFWLQPGRFHASIYRLDLNVLLANRELTVDRLRSNLLNRFKSINRHANSTNGKGEEPSDAGGKLKKNSGVANQEALISRHYAHPIITNLPKQTKLFFIDHKLSRIYVPITQQNESESENTNQPQQQQQQEGPDEINNSSSRSARVACDDPTSKPIPPAAAQILTFNLDSSDAGPLRSGSERDHWVSSFQPDGADMLDLTLDSQNNLLYWLTNGGRAIFEEYQGEDGKLHSAQHTLDGTNAYQKLIYFSPRPPPKTQLAPPLDNNINQNNETSTSEKSASLTEDADSSDSSKPRYRIESSNPIGTLMKIMETLQSDLDNNDQQLSSKSKKSIFDTNLMNGIASADLLVQYNAAAIDGQQRSQDETQYRFFSPSTSWFLFLGVGLLVFILYSLVFDQRRNTRSILSALTINETNSNNNNNHHHRSGPSSVGSAFSSGAFKDAASSLLGTGTISRWIHGKGSGATGAGGANVAGVSPSASLDVASNISSGLNLMGPNYALDLNQQMSANNNQILISNAIDEHYGQEDLEQRGQQYPAGMPHLSEWPSSISDFANKLYIPIEVLQDKDLASIRRISSDKLEIDRQSAPLGKGHFGTVLQGVIRDCSPSERAEWLAPASCRSNPLTPCSRVYSTPDYENQSRLENLLRMANEGDSLSTTITNNKKQTNPVSKDDVDVGNSGRAGDAATGAPVGQLGSGSSSGHGSTSNSDVFLSAQQASSMSGAYGGGTTTGDYLTPKSQCGQSSISDYDDRNNLRSGSDATSAIANPTYMFASTGACMAPNTLSLYDASHLTSTPTSTSPSAMMLLKPFKVAIKKLKDNPTAKEKQDFLQEAKLLAKFDHRNIVQLIGICLDRGSTLIVMELMLGGDLIRYMRKNCQNDVMTLEEDDLLSICLDIVDGCCYLAEMNYIHRDLAARNCLVSSCRREERVVKLADFGLARDIYEGNYYKQSNSESAMPLKWMAPECLCGEPTFTTQSDVWSFGVVMWEVTNYCLQTPYSSVAPLDLKKHFDAGKRLEKSKYCDDDLYKLMLQCWRIEPDMRPTFRECQIELIEIRNKLQKKQQHQQYLQQQYQYHYHHQQCEI